jgi:hypothetical protein
MRRLMFSGWTIFSERWLGAPSSSTTSRWCSEVVLGVALGEFVEEDLQAFVVHPRQVQTAALSRRGFDRRVQK